MKFPWFSIIRIKGVSMEPEYKPGDFVLISKSPFTLRNLKVNDDIVFNHAVLGKLLKQIISVQSDDYYSVAGLNPESISTEKLGLIHKDSIIGKVIYHISK